jgi:heparanase 1
MVCIVGADWTALNEFAHAAGLDLLFDLNVLLRNGTQWDSSNARLLLEYSDRHRFNISWQLGNGTYLSGNLDATLHYISA